MEFCFWNYGRINSYYGTMEQAVAEWKEMGITLGFTFRVENDPESHKKCLELLDACEKAGLQTVVYDARVNYEYLMIHGEEEYARAVAEAEKQFGSHPATWGWYVCDEPSGKGIDACKKAAKIVSKLSKKVPYVNSLPCSSHYPYMSDFNGFATPEEFYACYDEMIRECDLKTVGYDRYSQCYEPHEAGWQTYGVDSYFDNLANFGALARKYDKPFWVSQLSTGHWMYRTPTLEDVRWQISTAAAMGVDCLQWFFIYQHRWADDFWGYPIYLNGHKTELYYSIAQETESYKRRIGDKLVGFKFDGVWSLGQSVYGVEQRTRGVDGDFSFTPHRHLTMLVTRFVSPEGKVKYMITNANREYTNAFNVIYKGKTVRSKAWLPAGGACIVDPADYIGK